MPEKTYLSPFSRCRHNSKIHIFKKQKSKNQNRANKDSMEKAIQNRRHRIQMIHRIYGNHIKTEIHNRRQQHLTEKSMVIGVLSLSTKI